MARDLESAMFSANEHLGIRILFGFGPSSRQRRKFLGGDFVGNLRSSSGRRIGGVDGPSLSRFKGANEFASR